MVLIETMLQLLLKHHNNKSSMVFYITNKDLAPGVVITV